jgi:voltage-gated potassium channel
MDLRRRLLIALLLLISITAISVMGYLLLGGPEVSFLQALYMAVITLAGVGYGEIVETARNPALRVFNIFVVLVGVTIMLYVLSAVTAFLVEGEIRDLFWRRKMQKRIKELKDHYIVCGLGDTGRYAVEELQTTGNPYVVIESHEETATKLREHADFREMLYIIGDATDEAVLEEAGLARARGIIVALAGDKDNLVITVVVRQKSPAVRIVARCADVKFADRMMKAGANTTVSPNNIGGMRMASEALRPHVVSFLDLMLREKSRTLRIEEIDLAPGSAWCGLLMEEVKLRSRYHLLPLAVKTTSSERDMRFMVDPTDNLMLQPGMVLIVIGDVNEIRRARAEAQTKRAHAARAD